MSQKNLTELRNVLTQFLYGYYEELTKKYHQDRAKAMTFSVANELLEPFMPHSVGGISYYSLLSKWEQEWKEKEKVAIKEKDYDTQEKAMDILIAIRSLLPYAKEKDDDANGK